MQKIVAGRKEIHSELADSLGVHLAHLYNLVIRLQGFHWNVEGPQFHAAHAMFENFYKELWEEVDVVGERIRALGAYAPVGLETLNELSTIAGRGMPLDADAMLDDLITCCVVVREHAAKTRESAELLVDPVTSDMLTTHLAILEKALWMFRSSLSRAENDHPELKN